jgi:hypothetical protein
LTGPNISVFFGKSGHIRVPISALKKYELHHPAGIPPTKMCAIQQGMELCQSVGKKATARIPGLLF